jgi:hypothetical protein
MAAAPGAERGLVLGRGFPARAPGAGEQGLGRVSLPGGKHSTTVPGVGRTGKKRSGPEPVYGKATDAGADYRHPVTVIYD